MNRKPHHLSVLQKIDAWIFISLAALLLFFSLPMIADTFTERPWGYDSVAGDCVVCHSLEKGGDFRVAPNLWGIVGDNKARDQAWFNYSPGLVKMGGTWSEEDLDLFLADAAEFSPGSTKSIRISDSEERAEVIEFLAQLQD